jgi:hypothetical protein
MPGKSIVMAVVLSGWLIAAVIAFMIVAYASFFGIAVVGLMIWFVSTRVDLEQEGAVGVGVSPGFFARQVRGKVTGGAVDPLLQASRHRPHADRRGRVPVLSVVGAARHAAPQFDCPMQFE